MLKNAIFMVGCGKSGTTMLSNILLSHPDLGPKYNTKDIMIKSLTSLRNLKPYATKIEKSVIWEKFLGKGYYPLSEYVPPIIKNPLNKKQQEKLEEELIGQGLLKEKRLFNKNPMNTTRVHVLREIWKDSKIIFVRRNPADIISSWCEKKRSYGVSTIKKISKYWINYDYHIMKYKKDLGIYIINYEDLILNTNQELSRLYKFLNLDKVPKIKLENRIGIWKKRIPKKRVKRFHSIILKLKYDGPGYGE